MSLEEDKDCAEGVKRAHDQAIEATKRINEHPVFSGLAQASTYGGFEGHLWMGCIHVDKTKTSWVLTQNEKGVTYGFPHMPPSVHLKMDTIHPQIHPSFFWIAKDGKWVLNERNYESGTTREP